MLAFCCTTPEPYAKANSTAGNAETSSVSSSSERNCVSLGTSSPMLASRGDVRALEPSSPRWRVHGCLFSRKNPPRSPLKISVLTVPPPRPPQPPTPQLTSAPRTYTYRGEMRVASFVLLCTCAAGGTGKIHAANTVRVSKSKLVREAREPVEFAHSPVSPR